ncbi:MAG: glucose-6-phosphate isomerase, partial [Eubacteriales bacterium]
MAIRFSDKYLGGIISTNELASIKEETIRASKTLTERTGEGNDFLGWLDLPVTYDKANIEHIKAAAEKIKKSCDVLIVIGIGGSYLGARAAIEFVHGAFYNNKKKDTPDIYFVGNDISSLHLQDVLSICEGKDICINVISKSGTTTEPAIAFRVFRDLLIKKYGADGIKDRIFVTTDKARGALRSQVNEFGYDSFVVDDDIGGRYSVLSAVGLLPIAVSGADIDAMLDGAAKAHADFAGEDFENNDCLKYAAVRNLLYRGSKYRSAKSVEILAVNDPALTMTCEWWKQLFGESEGKDGKGIYPSSAT